MKVVFPARIDSKHSLYIIQDLKSLKEKFKEKVSRCSDVTIILDSLDQLSDHGAGLKDWIPKELPSSVTMVISAIPGEQFKVSLATLILLVLFPTEQVGKW